MIGAYNLHPKGESRYPPTGGPIKRVTAISSSAGLMNSNIAHEILSGLAAILKHAHAKHDKR
jgi:hypothetical protein